MIWMLAGLGGFVISGLLLAAWGIKEGTIGGMFDAD